MRMPNRAAGLKAKKPGQRAMRPMGPMGYSKGGSMSAKPNPKAPLGQGGRFAAIAAKAGGGKKGAAIAAAIGRKKYGAKKMAAMAAAGRRK